MKDDKKTILIHFETKKSNVKVKTDIWQYFKSDRTTCAFFNIYEGLSVKWILPMKRALCIMD